MTTPSILIWVVLPYVSIVLFIAGHIWRYRHDQFGWTSRSTQLLERRQLAWGSNLFHFGALAAIGGHVLGMVIPEQVTSAVGISEYRYHLLSAYAGTIAGLVCGAGLILLVYRRVTVRRIWVTTSYTDLAVYVLLLILIGLGISETTGVNLLGGAYDYRASVAVWFRGIFGFTLYPSLMARAPLLYQVHAATAWLLFALWPFSRLVHAWSIPYQYIGRPYILYRRRYPRTRRS
ncbi:MAG TPA: respiratory nitrate reductase subunit gamma [Chloroflexota bacterium]|nr:respiratory nitrate reductase subunit gamma [Chloroflexota bacterium]